MHVVIISQSTGRALPRARSIIDRFAVRFGTDTWMTPITAEALSGLRRDLTRAATREMSVACYRNSGMQKMSLLWSVGSRKGFSSSGGVAVASRLKKPDTIPEYAQAVKTMARICGLTHDIGKMNAFFQAKIAHSDALKKLGAQSLGDPVRHEWLSGAALDDVWEGRQPDLKRSRKVCIGNLKDMIQCHQWPDNSSPLDGIRWAISTHHLMLSGSAERNPDASSHCRLENYDITIRHKSIGKKPELRDAFRKDNVFNLYNDAPFPESIIHAVAKYRRNMETCTITDWRAPAIIARASLVLADHFYSSIKQEKNDGEKLRANSGSQQSLRTHLGGVALHAGRFSVAYLGDDFSGMSMQSIENIRRRSDVQSRFNWQNIAADFLAERSTGHPTLVFNLAGTGSGKTRANMLFLASLLQEDAPMRVTSVFNLRTLTVQTHRAYQHELGVQEEDMACMIGDPLAKKLNDIEQAVNAEDNSENHDNDDLECDVEGGYGVVPEWLEAMAKFDDRMVALLTPPVLVSTVDYVIAAGDFGSMKRHSSALMRLAHSDLILDEIDGYGPDALAAVCRVAMMSAMFGRNVVASSATLSKPVAEAIHKAFSIGCRMRGGMIGAGVSPQYVLVDDQTKPSACGDGDFTAIYDQHVEAMIKAVTFGPACRRYRPIPLNNPGNGNVSVMVERIIDESARLHADHHFEWDGVRVSVGLVRVANVRPCVQISRMLADRNDPGLMVTSYHASDMRLRRAMKEQRLDRVLTRKAPPGGNPNQAIMDDLEMRRAHLQAKGAGITDLRFIVVATPVEEIGRDHDFDWAIIEPSSAQSIVQTAGRVNRHRLAKVDEEHPNVAVFDVNLRKTGEQRCFRFPGYEIDAADVYPHHDMEHLLNQPTGALLHAGWRIGAGRALFAQCDDLAIDKFMQLAMDKLENPMSWHEGIFEKYALRAKSGMFAHIFRHDNDFDQMYTVRNGEEDTYADGSSNWGEHAATAFFCPNAEDVIRYADEIGEDPLVSQRFAVTMPAELRPIHFDVQFGGYGKRTKGKWNG